MKTSCLAPLRGLACVISILGMVYATAVTAQITTSLPGTVASPADNLSSPEKIDLGRLLFWDPILSGDSDVACATCHHPDFGYAENLDISVGVGGVGLGSLRHFSAQNSIPFVKRNSQSVLNTAFNGMNEDGSYDPAAAPIFWDVRANSLEEQALLPILTFEEMRGHNYAEDEILDEVVSRLKGIPEYQTLFSEAFGNSSNNDQAITSDNLGKALASFQRTLVAIDSPYDRYLAGDSNAMTSQQIERMRAFEDVGCAECHSGPMFSDFQLHVLGVPDNMKLPESDQSLNFDYAFRTPSLRNLEYTAPYMHSGVFSSLRDVLRFYDGGGRRGQRNPAVGRNDRDILFRRLDDVDDHDREIITFLGALNDDNFDKTIPSQVPSGLAVGGLIE
jgi:cytochrome c peroxidase